MSDRPPLTGTLSAAAIRGLRPPKPAVDPWRAHGSIDEVERLPDGASHFCRTVFLAGAECPFTCVFCDLWRFTTDEATPPGALPKQLESALGDGAVGIDCLKLYNASNFFEPRAVPPEDLPAIARLTAGRSRVVVECHPRLVDQRCLDFADLLDGRLELALGLETAHPGALARLNKGMVLEDFDRACNFARRHGLGLRAFVLLGTPYVPPAEAQAWVERSVRHAIDQGVEHIALIPLRLGNGALESLADSGEFKPVSGSEIERTFARSLSLAADRAVVSLDLWDIERHLESTPCCAAERLQRLGEMNGSGTPQPTTPCPACRDRA